MDCHVQRSAALTVSDLDVIEVASEASILCRLDDNALRASAGLDGNRACLAREHERWACLCSASAGFDSGGSFPRRSCWLSFVPFLNLTWCGFPEGARAPESSGRAVQPSSPRTSGEDFVGAGVVPKRLQSPRQNKAGR